MSFERLNAHHQITSMSIKIVVIIQNHLSQSLSPTLRCCSQSLSSESEFSLRQDTLLPHKMSVAEVKVQFHNACKNIISQKKMLVGAASNQCDCNGAVSASMEMMIKAVLPAFQSSYLQHFCKTFLNIKQIVFQSRPLAFRQRCRHINKCQKKKLFVDKIHCRRPWKRGLICTVVRCVS